MGNADSLGFTGGSRGVDDVGLVVDVHPRRGERCRFGVEQVLDGEPAHGTRKLLQHSSSGDAVFDACVCEHCGEPFGGFGRVDGHERRPGSRDCPCGRDGFVRTLQGNGHPRLDPHTVRHQLCGNMFCSIRELCTGSFDICCPHYRAARQHRGQQCGDGRGRRMRADQRILLLRVQHIEFGDGEPLGCTHQRTQQHQEAAVVGGELIGGVEGGVAEEVDAGAGTCDAGVDVDHHVVDGPAGQYPVFADDVAEPNCAVVHHDVDGGAEHASSSGGAVGTFAGRSLHVLDAESLVAQCAGEFHLYPSEQFLDGDARFDADAQGHDIGHHARGFAQFGGRAARDRQAEHRVFGVGHACEVQRERGEHNRDVGGVVPVCHFGYGCSEVCVQDGAHADAHSARCGMCVRGAGQSGGFEVAVEASQPVLAVGVVARGLGVRGLVVVDLPHADSTGFRDFGAFHQRGVCRSGAFLDGDCAESVHDDVVGTAVPVVVTVADLDDVGGDQLVSHQIYGSTVLLVHVALGILDGMLAVTEIAVDHRVRDAEVCPLVGNTVLQSDPHCGRFEPSACDVGGANQHGWVDIAVNLDVLSNGERHIRCQLLSEIDIHLSSGQRKAAVL